MIGLVGCLDENVNSYILNFLRMNNIIIPLIYSSVKLHLPYNDKYDFGLIVNSQYKEG